MHPAKPPRPHSSLYGNEFYPILFTTFWSSKSKKKIKKYFDLHCYVQTLTTRDCNGPQTKVNVCTLLFLDRRSFIDPICCYSCMVLSMLSGWFWPIFDFLCETSTWHLDSSPPEGTWYGRDSVGVESSWTGLKIRVRGCFASDSELSLLLRHTDEPRKGRNSCLWLQSRSVLSSFGVLMSCRVKFHVVRSALQYSACRI